MKNKCLWALIFCFSLVPWAYSQKPKPTNPGQVQRTAQRLTKVLQAKGFQVKKGYFKIWGIDDCNYTFDQLNFCLANNPAAPYIVMTVPPWPGEASISNLHCDFGPCHPGTEDIYRIDPREAIIILAQTPPPARYYSQQSWVFTREGAYDTTSQTYLDMSQAISDGALPEFILPIFFMPVPKLPAGTPPRIFLIASLSNPTNNFVIQNQTNTTPFNQQRYMIISPDAYMDTAVRDALKSLSIDEQDIFTEQIPSNLNLGLDRSSDDFITWMRYTRPDDGDGPGTPAFRWKKNLPIVVLRVRANDHQARPYPAFTANDFDPRTAFDEITTFQTDLNDLVAAVSHRWNRDCTNPDCSDRGAVSLIDLQTPPISMVGPLCTLIGENCLGDNPDAAYSLYGRMELDHGEVYALVGTLGTRTGNATYSAISVNQASKFKGVANIADPLLQDTAQSYPEALTGTKCPAANHPNTADCMFVYYFARDCSAVNTFTGQDNCLQITTKMIPEGELVVFGMRDYIRPGTVRGPDPTKILPPILIRVH